MNTSTQILATLAPEHAERLLRTAREVSFTAGTRIFSEGHRAHHFWILRNGTVALDSHVPGRRSPVVETLTGGELLGWSWLFPPYQWHLGAKAVSDVTAYEFDAAEIRALIKDDPELGAAVALFIADVVARRLTATRMRLLDLYGPYGSGPTP